MAGTSTPIYPQTLKHYVAQIVQASLNGNVLLCTGATNGTHLTSIMISSTDSAAARDLVFTLSVGSLSMTLTTISIPASSGNTNALPNVAAFLSTQWLGLEKDEAGNPYFKVPATSSLYVAIGSSTVSTGKSVNIVAQAVDF